MNPGLGTLAAIATAILTGVFEVPSSAYGQSREAEPATRAANDAFAASLPYADNKDFEDAKRGLVR
jgi:alkyl sulfatase BDS1-like metallo-beta-lactamase superfamily hydrolase